MALQDYIADTKYDLNDKIVTCLLILKDGKGTIVGQVENTGDETADKAAALKQASDSATSFLGLDVVKAANPAPSNTVPAWKQQQPPTVK